MQHNKFPLLGFIGFSFRFFHRYFCLANANVTISRRITASASHTLHTINLLLSVCIISRSDVPVKSESEKNTHKFVPDPAWQLRSCYTETWAIRWLLPHTNREMQTKWSDITSFTHSILSIYALEVSNIMSHMWFVAVCLRVMCVCVSGPMRSKSAFFTLIGCSCLRLRLRRCIPNTFPATFNQK